MTLSPLSERLRARKLLGIALDIAERHGATIEEIGSRSRLRHIAQARADLWRALHDMGWSYPAIAQLCDRDGSTVYQVVVGKQRGGETGAARG